MHHSNRLNCSGLTDSEFAQLGSSNDLIWECDKCVSHTVANLFSFLPHSDTSVAPSALSHEQDSNPHSNIFSSARFKHQVFILQCSGIDNFLNITENIDDDVATVVDSNYNDVSEFNSLKFDLASGFSLCHVNIASLECHMGDL